MQIFVRCPPPQISDFSSLFQTTNFLKFFTSEDMHFQKNGKQILQNIFLVYFFNFSNGNARSCEIFSTKI